MHPLTPGAGAWLALAAVQAAPAFDVRDCPISGPQRTGDEIWVVSITPGEQPFGYLGHTGVWIRTLSPKRNTWVEFGVVNSGRQAPGPALVLGTLEATWGARSIGGAANRITWQGRSAYAQRLDLSAQELDQLAQRLIQHGEAADRQWTPFHWADRSCATAIRDELDDVLGGALASQPAADVHTRPRAEVARHLASHRWAWWPLMLMVGAEADRPIGAFEAAFVPERLAGLLADASHPVHGRPLVRETCTLVRDGSSFAASSDPTGRWWALVLGLASALWLGIWGRPWHRPGPRRVLGLSTMGMGALLGSLGTISWALAALSSLEVLGSNAAWALMHPGAWLWIWVGWAWIRRGLGPRPRTVALALVGAALGLGPASAQVLGQDALVAWMVFLPGLATLGLLAWRTPARGSSDPAGPA